MLAAHRYDALMNQGTPTGNAGDGVVYDEGSIDLMGFVMRHRSLFLLSTIIAALLTVGAYAITQALPGSVVASYQVTLAFKGAAQGLYPNKAPFSPQDLIGTNVLEPVWTAQGLKERIDLADLARAVTISRSSRDLSLLQSEYDQKLANTKLTAAERQVLEGEFRSKLDALAKSGFTITCAASQLSAGEAERLVLAIPAEWARLSEAGSVTAYGFPLPQTRELRESAANLSKSSTDAADSILHAELLRDFVEGVERTISAMMAVQGTELAMSTTGETLVDLRQRVLALQRNLIMPAYIDTMAAAQEASPTEYLAITGVRRRMLDSTLETGKKRSEVLHEALDRVSLEQREARTVQKPGYPETGSGVIANVDGTFIDRVVEQAVRSRDVEYRRELSDRCVDVDLEVVDQQARVNFETWLSETIAQRGTSTRGTPTDAAATTERLVSLSNQIADLADRTREIFVTVSKRNLNPASVLYKGDIAPIVLTEVPVSTRTLAVAGVGLWFALLGLSALAGALQDRRRALA
jgi:hypothetical protein